MNARRLLTSVTLLTLVLPLAGSAAGRIIYVDDNGSEHDPDYKQPAAQIDGHGNVTIVVALWAERAGNGGERIYQITATVTDDSGSTTTDTVEVTVPHDQGGVNCGE